MKYYEMMNTLTSVLRTRNATALRTLVDQVTKRRYRDELLRTALEDAIFVDWPEGVDVCLSVDDSLLDAEFTCEVRGLWAQQGDDSYDGLKAVHLVAGACAPRTMKFLLTMHLRCDWDSVSTDTARVTPIQYLSERLFDPGLRPRGWIMDETKLKNVKECIETLVDLGVMIEEPEGPHGRGWSLRERFAREPFDGRTIGAVRGLDEDLVREFKQEVRTILGGPVAPEPSRPPRP